MGEVPIARPGDPLHFLFSWIADSEVLTASLPTVSSGQSSLKSLQMGATQAGTQEPACVRVSHPPLFRPARTADSWHFAFTTP